MTKYNIFMKETSMIRDNLSMEVNFNYNTGKLTE